MSNSDTNVKKYLSLASLDSRALESIHGMSDRDRVTKIIYYGAGLDNGFQPIDKHRKTTNPVYRFPIMYAVCIMGFGHLKSDR